MMVARPLGKTGEPPRCLIVTEDRFLERLVDLLMNHGEYIRKRAPEARGAEETIDEWHPHLAILDIDIDGGRGIDLVDQWKARGIPLPIIGLTRRNTILARLGAFERGIDDLLVIPFPPEELVARCIGVMRRVPRRDVAFVPEIEVGPLSIDLLQQMIRANGNNLDLTPIEKALLYILAGNAGETMSRDQLLDYIWGLDRDVGSNLIDRHVAD